MMRVCQALNGLGLMEVIKYASVNLCMCVREREDFVRMPFKTLQERA